MPTVKIIKEIAAPPRKTWEFISDIEQAPEWVQVMQSLVHTTNNPVQHGTIYREKSKIGPKASETEWKVVRFEAPYVQVHECREPDFHATLTMRVEEGKNGKSVLRHTTNYRLMPSFRPLGWLAETLFIKRLMRRKLNESVTECKRLIEEQAPNSKAS